MSSRKKKILGAAGITVVLGSWILIPVLAKQLYGIAPIDTAFRLTVFWSVIWLANKLREKFL